MRDNTVLKFALIASLVLNISFLATVGYLYYKKSSVWISPFGTVMKKDRFLFEELSLSPEQMKTLKEHTIPFRKEIDRRRYEIAQKRKAMLDLLRTDAPAPGAITAVVSEISRMQEEMQHMIVTHMLEIKNSLDKDQQKRFLDLIERSMTGGRQLGCPPLEQNQ